MNSNPSDHTQPNHIDQETIDRLQTSLHTIETILTNQLQTLKKTIDIPEEIDNPTEEGNSLLQTTQRITSALKRYNQAEDNLKRENSQLKQQLKNQRYALEEVEMERDVLLQQVHAYLETNSSLRVRLEEQRCQTGTVHKKANENLELRIKSLEDDKEKLTDLNMEKEKQIHKITLVLEQTAKCLKNRETEVLNWKNEENNLVTMLKADLQKALDDKANTEKKYANLKNRMEDMLRRHVGGVVSFFGAVGPRLKRSSSVGDVSSKLNFLEKNITMEAAPNRETVKSTEDSHWKVHASRSWPNGVSSTTDDRPKSPPIHTQLNSLRRGLFNVTRKLDALKIQLTSTGVIAEEPSEIRSLKRKARSVEEDDEEGITEEQKSGFKNLKNILQDAKNLNAKLENLREEKQKIMNMKKDGSRVGEKSQQFDRTLENAVLKLKKAVNDCEHQLDEGVVSKEEALAGLVSPFFSILNNIKCFHEGDSLTDDGSEDGGGDNPMKKQSPKVQMARMKYKSDHLHV